MTATTTTTRKPKPKPTTLRLVVQIGATSYHVKPLPPAPAAGISRLVRFRRLDTAAVHHVAQAEHGATCDCGDQVWRHEGKDDVGCRHIRAARALGLLDAPAFEPTDADLEAAERQRRFAAAAVGR